MTEEQIVSVVKKGLAESASLYLASSGMTYDEDDPSAPRVIACTERMFFQDPQTHHLIVRNDSQTIDINDQRNRNTLFAVIMLSQGNHNFAVSQNQVSIQILSEQGDFELAQGILRTHLNRVNYRAESHYVDGTSYNLIETYNNPDIAEDQMAVFAGLRALVIMRGIILIQEETVGTATITGITFSLDDGESTYRLPFIAGTITNAQSPDPQAFPVGVYGGDGSDMSGWTSTKNRQSTLTVGLQTYFADWTISGDAYSEMVSRISEIQEELADVGLTEAEKAALENELETKNLAIGLKQFSHYIVVDVMKNHNFNKPIHLSFETNVLGDDDEPLLLIDADFVPNQQVLAFQLGQYSLPTFTFSETNILV